MKQPRRRRSEPAECLDGERLNSSQPCRRACQPPPQVLLLRLPRRPASGICPHIAAAQPRRRRHRGARARVPSATQRHGAPGSPRGSYVLDRAQLSWAGRLYAEAPLDRMVEGTVHGVSSHMGGQTRKERAPTPVQDRTWTTQASGSSASSSCASRRPRSERGLAGTCAEPPCMPPSCVGSLLAGTPQACRMLAHARRLRLKPEPLNGIAQSCKDRIIPSS